MSVNKAVLSFEEKMGFFLGTVLFILTLPLSLFFSAIPGAMLGSYFSNSVLSAGVGLLFLGLGTFANFIFSMVIGLATGFVLCSVGRKFCIPELYYGIWKHGTPVESQKYTVFGAWAGGGFAVLLFIVKGKTPIQAISERVEHLFPVPLVLNLGQFSTLDLSHLYAVITGFLTVGFLFGIAGIALGSLSAALFERILSKAS